MKSLNPGSLFKMQELKKIENFVESHSSNDKESQRKGSFNFLLTNFIENFSIEEEAEILKFFASAT